MSIRRASDEALELLHAALADTLSEAVKRVKTSIAPAIEGAEPTEVPKGAASLLNVARQFLKDNGIEAIPSPDSPMKSLVDSLPFDEDEEQSTAHPMTH